MFELQLAADLSMVSLITKFLCFAVLFGCAFLRNMDIGFCGT